MDDASYRGRETETQALGTTWRFARWTVNVLDDFTAWAKTQLPDPIDVAQAKVDELAAAEFDLLQRKDMPEPELKKRLFVNRQAQERLSKIAMEKACSYLAFTAPEFQSLLNSSRGSAQLLQLLLRKHHPNVTADEAFNIATAVEKKELERIFAVTAGKSPPSGNSPAPAA
ncbi:MAG: hypothetical protein K2R98_08500 [Gemmataceae bacterium]|nr:hypothetical protein [Gemmataceae bacterium]